MKSILITGPAGAGKTALAEYSARKSGAELIYYLCHEWSVAEDFLFEVSIPAVAKAMAGQTPSNFYKEGVLARALRLSQSRRVVLLLDELDKASSRIDALLLDFLQNARLPLPEGGFLFGNPDHIQVWITSNGQREVIDPLARRLFKLELGFLPSEVEAQLLAGTPSEFYLDGVRRFILRYMEYEPVIYEAPTLQKFIAKVGAFIRSKGLDISLFELKQLYLNLPVCENREEVELLVKGWLCRNEEYESALRERFAGLANLANALLDLYRRERK